MSDDIHQTGRANVVKIRNNRERHEPHPLVTEYIATLNNAPGTIDNYRRAIEAFTTWLDARPSQLLTATALITYLAELDQRGYSTGYRVIVKSAVSGFADWLIDKGLLKKNPARGVKIPAEQLLAPRVLTEDQRYVLKSLVEGAEDVRGAALFALGYWAGCRVSDVSYLLVENTHVGERSGWIRVGHKGGKMREIDLAKAARQALYEYLQLERRPGAYVFQSARSERLTEDGIHYWFRTLKQQANHKEYALIADVSFHDLRHDFAHRARQAGWQLEEIAVYLGHVNQRGGPAIQTTVRYTQPSREQIKDKLKLLESGN